MMRRRLRIMRVPLLGEGAALCMRVYRSLRGEHRSSALRLPRA
jgi:hypothetical protein